MEGTPGPHSSPDGARLLRVDLSHPELLRDARPGPFTPRDARLSRVGAWGGSALAVAVLLERLRADACAPPFVVAVGEAVRRGLPTAARATVAGVAPLTGLYAEGQVGGELARRLSAVTDALVLEGRTQLPGAVLQVGPGGALELVSLPELVGRSVHDAARRLAERFGPAGALVVGPAGEAGVRFASLANAEDPPSFVGRGGLGAAFARLGLKALVVDAPLQGEVDVPPALARALLDSPRLRARAEGGTMELLHAFAARGDLRTRNYAAPLDAQQARALSEQARAAERDHKGCRGCPTPCGLVFERAPGERQGARFGAVYAVGPNLGLEDFDDALALLRACDEAGLDAKEMGAALSVLAAARDAGAAAGPPLWGQREALVALVRDTGRGVDDGARLGRGAAALARELGVEAASHDAKGQAARPESNLAVVLGQCVSSRGADPIKSFPFLTADACDRERLEELLEPLTCPEGTEDPRRPEGKGRLVWWHENLALALDATGFCAFSAAGLLADGVLSPDELGEALLSPERLEELGGDGGQALHAMGAALAVLQRELNGLLGAEPDADRPEWARAELERPGMWNEYRVLRGLDEDGRPTAEASARVGTPELFELGFSELEDPFVLWPRAGDAPRGAQLPARCRLRSFGSLARALGPELELLLQLPARTEDVLDQIARRSPEAGPLLVQRGRPVATLYRDGRRLGPGDWVEEGDVLDLVVAISGG